MDDRSTQFRTAEVPPRTYWTESLSRTLGSPIGSQRHEYEDMRCTRCQHRAKKLLSSNGEGVLPHKYSDGSWPDCFSDFGGTRIITRCKVSTDYVSRKSGRIPVSARGNRDFLDGITATWIRSWNSTTAVGLGRRLSISNLIPAPVTRFAASRL